MLRKIKIAEKDITDPGDRESQILKTISNILRPLGQFEGQLNAKTDVDRIKLPHDNHKIDYIKDRVAFDLE